MGDRAQVETPNPDERWVPREPANGADQAGERGRTFSAYAVRECAREEEGCEDAKMRTAKTPMRPQ